MKEQIIKKQGHKKVFKIVTAFFLLAIVITGVIMTRPANTMILDVNPSVELKTNRLKKVVEVKPLNDDAKKLLKGFKMEDDDIEDVVESLIDLMILEGYIAGGDDNLVMVTVDDKNANKDMVDKVNKAIAAYLENRQLEAAVLNQTVSMDDDDLKIAKEKKISLGKLNIIKRLIAHDKSLTYEEMESVSLKDLVLSLEKLDIKPEELFDNYVRTLRSDDDHDDVLETDDEKDRSKTTIAAETISKSDKADKRVKKEKISSKEAKSIALKLADGKIEDFELDEDDGRLIYEIEIKAKGVEHEIEIDAYTGEVIEHEVDDDYDDDRYDDDYDDDYDD